jgi:molecular chaperone DnaK (HSP70)
MKKKILVNQIKIAPIQGANTVPTKIAYDGKSHRIGGEADKFEKSGSRVFENFKVELGRQSKEKLRTDKKVVSKGHSRTVMGITKDFLESVCDEVFKEADRLGHAKPQKVLVAEPITLEEDGKTLGEWLSNYRFAVKSALSSKFDEIDFLPEPFAVFQYYRYGYRHPLLSEQGKHVALVMDFGGGTFDVSVIETTKDGDISHSGRNSRPLASKSISVGGYFVNRVVAEDIILENIKDNKKKKSAREFLKRIPNFQGLTDFEAGFATDQEKDFANNFRALLSAVEAAKVRICKSISNWSLNSDLSRSVSHLIPLRVDPFDANSKLIEVSLTADRLRHVFVQQVWNNRLRDAILRAVGRAKTELKNKPISVVLLSGGSTNIGWTKELIERDLGGELSGAQILEIGENYQEVVAKGLAVECARQFYTEGDGDFGAVTYNTLNLALRPDDKPAELRKFQPRAEGLPISDVGGTLLNSAASLRAHIDKTISWRVRLSSAPRHSLDYHYLKSSFDPTDLENVHNVVDNRIHISQAVYGQSIDVELHVREDGTATPAFLFSRDKASEHRVTGIPFFLDMTYAGELSQAESYLGLDFGTATSAGSLVFQNDIKAYLERERDSSWSELSDLLDILPYSIAHPLANYVAQTEVHLLEKYGKRTLEAMITFIVYSSFADIASSSGDSETRIPPNFNRSLGPMKDLGTRLADRVQDNTLIAKKMLSVFQGAFIQDINNAIAEINNIKHDRAVNIDFNYLLGFLGNQIKDALSGCVVGKFISTSRRTFGGGYEGNFRALVGPNEPFVKLYNYQGPSDFSLDELFIVHIESGSAISLSPFYYSGAIADLGSHSKCPVVLIDGIKGKYENFTYIPVREGNQLNVGERDDLEDLLQYCKQYMTEKSITALFEGINLTKRNAESG